MNTPKPLYEIFPTGPDHATCAMSDSCGSVVFFFALFALALGIALGLAARRFSPLQRRIFRSAAVILFLIGGAGCLAFPYESAIYPLSLLSLFIALVLTGMGISGRASK